MITAIWLLTAVGLAIWTLLAWGLHRVLTMDTIKLDDVRALAERWPYGAWIERWFPGWKDLLGHVLDVAQTTIQWTVGDVALWVLWTLWGIGALGMLVTTGFLAWTIKVSTPPPAARPDAKPL